ncbi:hypothetical protein Cha6605_1459 [Chamaesiphon minutus PCC 6605]|uniref:Uncharacterized protein n=1 Tax=Chamaesiphon minutus (strain ATCC 27169 / PCC 6605) TaxID=1173020 RepID=K9UDA0_CHAP6|nr:hypothetical protein Cha6605_1459 [Chamaesiphon minutus PCC 6605]
MLSTIAAIGYICVFKLQQSALSFKSQAEVPCHRCRYFNNNLYLKCAIYPEIVFTERSIDCVNYYPKDRSIVEKNLFCKNTKNK